jgi:hypothetical protein
VTHVQCPQDFERFEHALLALLAQLESGADGACIEAAALTCRRAFDALEPEHRAASAERQALERCTRLMAVLRGEARRELDETAQRMRLARQARRAFAGQRDAIETNGSMNCAG